MRRGNIFLGLILLLFGGLLFLDNLGIFNLDIWGLFWLLILILTGVGILWGSLLGEHKFEVEERSISLEGAKAARVQLSHGAGILNIHADDKIGTLLWGKFGGGLDYRTKRVRDKLNVELGVKNWGIPLILSPLNWFSRTRRDWDIGLSKEIPLELEFRFGANEALVDLSDILATDIHIQAGANSTEVKLPANAEFTHLKVNAGAALIKLLVPDEVAASIQVNGGLMDASIDKSRFPRKNHSYQSTDYESANHRIEILVDIGLGSVIIQ